MKTKQLDGQLTIGLFERDRQPSWDDVQKKRATVVKHEPYTQPCTSSCMWRGSIYDGRCYLFQKSIIDGRCPSTCRLEWTE